MPKFFDGIPPEQLQRELEEGRKIADQERAERKKAFLRKRMKRYLEPFEQIKADFAETREKYEKEPSSEELEALAQSILEVSEKRGEEKSELEIRRVTVSTKNLYRFMREKHRLEKILERSNEELEQAVIEARADSLVFNSTSFKDEIAKWRHFNRNISNVLEKELPNKNPESFKAHFLLKLRKYQEELKTGIVETETVKKRKEVIIDKLTNEGLVALVGETGTGKTRLAIKIADELNRAKKYGLMMHEAEELEKKAESVESEKQKATLIEQAKKLREEAKEVEGEHEFAVGHEKMTKEELIYYLSIKPETINALEVPKQIEMLQERYMMINNDLTPEQEKDRLKWIEEVVLGQAKEKALETKIILGPVIKAAKEGKVVIIDEFNFIPPETLAMLNSFIDAKPGEPVEIMGERFKVQEGFGVILTGNISRRKVGRYLKRQELGAALINRLNSGLLEYGTLPQEYDKVLQASIIEQEKFQQGEEPPQRELFEIGLAHLLNEDGELEVPKDALDKVWRLCQKFSLLQKIFAGEPLRDEVATSEAGCRYNLVKYHASMRTFGDILEGWRNDGFNYPLEWYIYDNLIRPPSIVAPTESAQICYIFKHSVAGESFFDGEEWKDLKAVDTREADKFTLFGVEKIPPESKEKFWREAKKQYLPAKEIAEAVSGIKMPKQEMKTKKEKKIARQKEISETYKELYGEIKEAEKALDEWKESIDLFCEGEKSISK